jgi:DNA-binding SARP family transcriptional activator/tetratricopeptide (TPR) repeat protein
MPIRLSLFGDFAAHGAPGPPLPVRGKVAMLLAYLARRSPERVRREELAALFWGERPEQLARQSLRHALLKLRRAIGDDVVRVGPDDVRLEPSALTTDATEFEDAIRDGRLAHAVALHAGDFLAGFEATGGEELRLWLEAEREGLRRKLAWALDQLIARAETSADWSAALEYATRRSEADPLDEAAQIRRLRLLRLAGRPADAIAEHACVLHLFREEYGVEPGEALRRVEAELEQPPTGGAAGPVMAGRRGAFNALVTSWQAGAAAGSCVLITGEEGSGRTRLLDAFLHWVRAHTPDALVLAAAGSGHAEPHRPLVSDVLAGLRHARGLSGAADDHLAEIGVLVPTIRDRFPQLPPASGTEEALDRGLTSVLRDVATEQPTLIAIDDFDDADATSCRILRSLAADVPAGVTLVMVSRAAATSLPGAARIPLRPLTAADVDVLLATSLATNAPARARLAQRIQLWTGGNASFAVEVLDALLSDGRLRRDADGDWAESPDSLNEPLPVPGAARRRVLEQLTLLSERERRVLESLAALDEIVDDGLLLGATGLDAKALDAALVDLAGRDLLRPDENGTRLVPCIRAAVLDEVPPVLRQSLRTRSVLQPGRAAGRSRGTQRRRRVQVAAVLTLVAVTALAALQRPGRAVPPSLAVGDIVDLTADGGGAGVPLTDLLATRLARLPEFDVVSPERMHELRAGLDGQESSLVAARVTGARQIVQGSMYARPGGGLRLELRRVDIRTGAAVAGHIIDALDPISLVDGAIAEIAAEFGVAAVRPEPERPASLVAYRMYEEGLRAYYRGDALSAHRFFSAALAEDSTFAMAAFYDWLSKYWASLLGADSQEQLARVVALAQHAGDRERLLIRAMWADHTRSPARLALADTLAIRYPLEPDGYYYLGRAHAAAGDFRRAISYFERVVRMDSVGFLGTSLRCRACDAMAQMVAAYSLADSAAAAERTAVRWTRLQPGAARPWVYLASQFEYQGRFDEALEARRAAMPHQPANVIDPVYPAIIALRRGDYAAADRMLIERMNGSSQRAQRSAAWFLIISLRQQGRHDEALHVASTYSDTLARAVTLMEMGRNAAGAALFRALASARVREPTRFAEVQWPLTHAASAHADPRDADLHALADSVEALGTASGHARDRRLAHYIRGRALAAAGRHAEAVQSYERAMFSPTNGYALLNLHHARSLLALNRSRDAIALLQPPLRGPLDAGNFYVPQTDLRLELGRAFEQAAMPDSAAVQYRLVLAAWSHADARMHARRDSVAHRLAVTQGRAR